MAKAEQRSKLSARRKMHAEVFGVFSIFVVVVIVVVASNWNPHDLDTIPWHEANGHERLLADDGSNSSKNKSNESNMLPTTVPKSSGSDGSMYPADPFLSKPYREKWLEGRPGTGFILIFHIIVLYYMVCGLNLVCDVYFAGSLEVMVTTWKIKPDVAGATFMAAGGSAPELFTSIIGTCVAQNDVGFGTIVGSAVFNVLFVIGLCGWIAKEPIRLTWWPLFRDCVFYVIGLASLACCAWDERIKFHESLILFLEYLVYCTLMYFNTSLEKKAYEIRPAKVTPEPVSDVVEKSGNNKDDQPEATPEPESTNEQMAKQENVQLQAEEDDDDEPHFMEKPESKGALVLWLINLPMYAPIWYLTPEPTEKLFIVTFLQSLVYIGGFSFILVWFVDTLCLALGIDVIFAGITFLAAATSIPDAVSSMAVAKKGEGDMAVSSSIGSNIFDILVGLPIPWMLKVFIELSECSGLQHEVRIKAPFVVFYVLVLLGMVAAVVGSIHALKWYLNQTLGAFMAVLYFIFLVVVLIVQNTKPQALRFNNNTIPLEKNGQFEPCPLKRLSG